MFSCTYLSFLAIGSVSFGWLVALPLISPQSSTTDLFKGMSALAKMKHWAASFLLIADCSNNSFFSSLANGMVSSGSRGVWNEVKRSSSDNSALGLAYCWEKEIRTKISCRSQRWDWDIRQTISVCKSVPWFLVWTNDIYTDIPWERSQDFHWNNSVRLY